MKRIIYFFTILLIISIGGCNDKETLTPEETNQETENYRIVKLGEDFPIKVGEKILIKDTLFVNDSTGRANDISPVYLNYLLTLDSIVDKRGILEEVCPYDYYPHLNFPAEAHFTLNNEHFVINSHLCVTTMDVICKYPHLAVCDTSTYECYYSSITNNLGISFTLCYVSPHPDSLNPHPQQSEYTAYLVVNSVIK